MDLFTKLLKGEPVDMMSEEYGKAIRELNRSNDLSFRLNQLSPLETDRRKELFAKLLQEPLQEHTDIFTPVQIDFGCNLKIGKHVFINHSLTVMAIGGITIGDNVQIGPQVTIVTDNHDPVHRYVLRCKQVIIKNNVWIGARVVIMPGVTVGENSIIAGGAVVTKNVPPNTVAGGCPAKVLKNLGG
jgi:acetyltransferase-like isoleucine patch superfamily enzyme